MSDVIFKTYAGGLPAATTPPARTDELLIVQGSDVNLIQVKDLIAGIPLYTDATSAPVTVDIAGFSAVTVVKTDSSAHSVTILDSSVKTILHASSITLTNQDEAISLQLFVTNWYQI